MPAAGNMQAGASGEPQGTRAADYTPHMVRVDLLCTSAAWLGSAIRSFWGSSMGANCNLRNVLFFVREGYNVYGTWPVCYADASVGPFVFTSRAHHLAKPHPEVLILT